MSAFCADCEAVQAQQRVGEKCRICGCTLTAMIPDTSSAAQPTVPAHTPTAHTTRTHNPAQAQAETQEALLSRLRDLFGAEALSALSQRVSPQRELTEDYLQSVGALTVDERQSVLRDVSLALGPLRPLAIPASFSALSLSLSVPCTDSSDTHTGTDTATHTETERASQESEHVLEARVVLADPVHGDASSLANAEQCRGNVVLFKRGKVSFAQKARLAEAAGAKAAIIMQICGKWPFHMTDSANELQGRLSRIPCLMISEEDGELCEKYIKSMPNPEMRVIFKGEESGIIRQCAICQEAFSVGESVLRLACRHTYHTACLTQWLPQRHSCPLCRSELRSQSTHTHRARATAGGTESERELRGDHGGYSFFS